MKYNYTKKASDFMVLLKNIKKDDNIIGCDIYPEDSISPGRVLVDISTGDVCEYTLPDGYEWCISHVQHARAVLLDISCQCEIPGEKMVMWY
jgi:hypothetical protein